MKITDNLDKELMQVTSIEPDASNTLVIRGKIFGAMPMTAKLTPDEARAALKLLNAKTIWFILTLLFRKTKTGNDAGDQAHGAAKGRRRSQR